MCGRRALNCRADLVGIGGVGSIACGADPVFVGKRRSGRADFFAVSGGEGERRARFGECLCDGGADAAAGAGDQRMLSVQRFGHAYRLPRISVLSLK